MNPKTELQAGAGHSQPDNDIISLPESKAYFSKNIRKNSDFSGIARVQQDFASAELFTVTDLGRGHYAISFAGHTAAAKGAAVKLQVFLKGNLTEKPNAALSIKVTLK